MNIRNNKLLPFTSQYRVIKVLFAFSKGEIKVILPIYARYGQLKRTSKKSEQTEKRLKTGVSTFI